MFKNRLVQAINKATNLVGLTVTKRWQAEWWTAGEKFQFGGRTFDPLYHSKSGFPPARTTERPVELALADAWLIALGSNNVVEVGAVTPYYWPGRVHQVIDPFDPHPSVTARKSVMEVDLHAANVLSISTLEHVGSGDYGLPKESGGAVAAFCKLFDEAARFFVTVPVGQNAELDAFFFDAQGAPDDVSVRFVVRSPAANDWSEAIGLAAGRQPYGERGYTQRSWANSVMILERGGLL